MLLGLVALTVAACSGDDATPEATSASQTATATSQTSGGPGSDVGTLEVRVTDAPDPSITAVYVTTDKIEVSVAGQGWITVIDEEITFELLALEGVEAVLGTAELPTGKYTQVRLSVPEVEIEKDGERVIAEVPSDTIKLVGNFELAAGETTFISLDFEVDKSLVDRQRQGFLFKPVIKLAVGEPGDEGPPTVALTGKPEPTVVPSATPVPPADQATATSVPSGSNATSPTSTPGPTATPDATGAFFLDIEGFENGEAYVTTSSIDVTGRTSIDALVTVNDTFADVAIDGTFTSTVELDEGPNIVEVVASTSSGDESSIVLLIIYEAGA